MSISQSAATGLSAFADTSQSFSAAQAARRFYASERVSLPALAEPILDYARQMSRSRLARFALVRHDFSSLNFTSHESKRERISLYRKQDAGYFRKFFWRWIGWDAPSLMAQSNGSGGESPRAIKIPIPKRCFLKSATSCATFRRKNGESRRKQLLKRFGKPRRIIH